MREIYSMKYPVRCQIVDVTGKKIFPGVEGNTPEVSKPHVGKKGLAEMVNGQVRIMLDDGTVIWGYECWWKHLKKEEGK